MKLSIVTSFYNSENYIVELANSIIKQNYNNWEWIVADDFSSDNTGKILEELSQLDNRIKLKKPNYKKEIWWNPQLHATGDIVCPIDGDDKILPNTFEKIVYYFEKFPDVIFMHFNANKYQDVLPKTKDNFLENFVDNVYISRDNNSFLEAFERLTPERTGIFGYLRIFKNIPELNFKVHQDGDICTSNDAQWLINLEEKGKWLTIPRTVYIARQHYDSENFRNWNIRGEVVLIKEAKERRQKLNLENPRKNTFFDDIYEAAESTYISLLNWENCRKKVGFFNFNYDEKQNEKLKILFFDHDIFFDEFIDLDYAFVKINSFDDAESIYNITSQIDCKINYYSDNTHLHNNNRSGINNLELIRQKIQNKNPIYFNYQNFRATFIELIKNKDKQEFKNKIKIKLIHLQTTVNDNREIASYESVSRVSRYGIEYILHKNELYTQLPPRENCIRPKCVSMNIFDQEKTDEIGSALTPAHYGCYESFKNAIIKEFDEDVDFLMICEGDCIIEVALEEFISKVYKAAKLIDENDIGYFSFGDVDTLDLGWKQSDIIEEIPNQDLIFITNKIIGLQCIMFPKSHREFLIDNLNNHNWDAADIYFETIFKKGNKKMGIIKDRITTQADGYSFIDNQYKKFIKKTTNKINQIMNLKDTLLDVYDKTPITIKENKIIKTDVIFSYFKEPRIDLKCEEKYEVKFRFFDNETNDLLYETTLRNNMFAQLNREYHRDFYIQYKLEGKTHIIKPSFENQRIYIHLDSSSLGDTIAWFPQIEEFRIKNNCKVICSTFHNSFFEKNYPEIEFVQPGSVVHNLYKMFTIGWFYDDKNEIVSSKNPFNFRDQHLQKTACDILGLEFKEIKPKIDFTPSERPTNKKYFCIANHSTAQSKYWNNPNGWQEVVDYLKSNDYEVFLLSKEPDNYMGNKNPKGVIKIDGKTIQEICNYIYHSEGFIGLGSGLSWLSWSLNKPTVLISGFSRPICEMIDCERVFVEDQTKTCNGCFNDFRLDPADWNWCPRHKGTSRQFECTKSITSNMVIDKINKIIF